MTDYDHKVIERWMAANGWTLERANVVLPWAGPEPAVNEWVRHNPHGPHGPHCYLQVPINRTLGGYQRRLEQLVETLQHMHEMSCKTVAEQAYERMQRSVEGAAQTDDERMRQIRERAATWRQMGDCGDDGPIAIALYLLERLDAVTAGRDAYRAAIVAHNAPILDRIELLRDKVNEHRERARVEHTRFDDLECDCEREALAWMRAIDRESERLIRINGEVVK